MSLETGYRTVSRYDDDDSHEALCLRGITLVAWDFLGAVTFSKKFGYMEEGCDFDGTLAIGDKAIDYLGMCGQMPWLDHWLDKNPVYPLGPPNIANVTRIAVEMLTARLKGEDNNFNPEKPDFLEYYIDSKEKHPEVVNEGTIIGYLLLNRTSTFLLEITTEATYVLRYLTAIFSHCRC